MIAVAFDPIYVLPLPENHRFPMEKYDLLPKQLMHEGICDRDDFFSPKPLSDQIVKTLHQSDYVDRLKRQDLNRSEIRKIGFPISQQLVEREFVIAGGTVEGALKSLQSGISFNIAGGTHHAYSTHGEAFCMLNDQAIAAQYLLDHHHAQRILIIDLDVHQGNGTAEIFKNEDRVFTFSMHGQKNYPFKKEQSDWDIPLEDKTGDERYLNVLNDTLPQLFEQVDPDFVFYLSGVDVVATDRLGRLAMSLEGCKQRDEQVLEFCHKLSLPVQCSMGGGYSEDIKLIIEAHANTYRVAQRIF
ncbi:histone deacetylase [Flavobacteriaceae bacterium]|nr:histone deacetylase [Flavobacteriaceae bacterium]MDC0479026.1 histone deacetylase [Flavobacteriaceae bacterium]